MPLTKVDYDPFAAPEGGLTKVDYDPFTTQATPATPAIARPDGFFESAKAGFKRSLPETKSLLYGATGAVAGAVGLDSVRDWGVENYQRVQKEEVEPLQGKSGFQSSLKGETSFADWAGDTIGNFGGQAVQSLAAAAAGAAVGSAVPFAGTVGGAVAGAIARPMAKKLVGEEIAELVAKGAAKDAVGKATLKRAGMIAAPTALNIAQETGIGFTGRAEDAEKAGEQLTQADALRAIGWGVPAGLVDTAAEALTAARVLRGGTGEKLVKRVAAGAARGAVTEGATEGVQAVMERAGANRELTGEEAYNDYIENVAAGALGGSVAGGGGSVRKARVIDEVLKKEGLDQNVGTSNQPTDTSEPLGLPAPDGTKPYGVIEVGPDGVARKTMPDGVLDVNDKPVSQTTGQPNTDRVDPASISTGMRQEAQVIRANAKTVLGRAAADATDMQADALDVSDLGATTSQDMPQPDGFERLAVIAQGLNLDPQAIVAAAREDMGDDPRYSLDGLDDSILASYAQSLAPTVQPAQAQDGFPSEGAGSAQPTPVQAPSVEAQSGQANPVEGGGLAVESPVAADFAPAPASVSAAGAQAQGLDALPESSSQQTARNPDAAESGVVATLAREPNLPAPPSAASSAAQTNEASPQDQLRASPSPTPQAASEATPQAAALPMPEASGLQEQSLSATSAQASSVSGEATQPAPQPAATLQAAATAAPVQATNDLSVPSPQGTPVEGGGQQIQEVIASDPVLASNRDRAVRAATMDEAAFVAAEVADAATKAAQAGAEAKAANELRIDYDARLKAHVAATRKFRLKNAGLRKNTPEALVAAESALREESRSLRRREEMAAFDLQQAKGVTEPSMREMYGRLRGRLNVTPETPVPKKPRSQMTSKARTAVPVEGGTQLSVGELRAQTHAALIRKRELARGADTPEAEAAFNEAEAEHDRLLALLRKAEGTKAPTFAKFRRAANAASAAKATAAPASPPSSDVAAAPAQPDAQSGQDRTQSGQDPKESRDGLDRIVSKTKAIAYLRNKHGVTVRVAEEMFRTIPRGGLKEGTRLGADVAAIPVDPKQAKPKKYNPAKKPRGLLDAIASSGGLRRDEFRAEGVDPAEFSRRIGIHYLFRANGGMGMDRLQEWMQQEHYLPRDPEDGQPIVDRNDVLDKLFTALAGNDVFADDQAEAVAAYRMDQKQALDEFRAELEGDPEFGVLTDEQFEAMQAKEIAELSERAYDLGATDSDIVGAAFDANNSEQHRQALQKIVERLEAKRATDAKATNQAGEGGFALRQEAQPEPRREAQEVSGGLDHGVLNIPLNKRGNIDRELDKYKDEQAKAEKAKRKDGAAELKAAREEAKALVEGLSDERIAAFGKKAGMSPAKARKSLQSEAHWQPKNIIKAFGQDAAPQPAKEAAQPDKTAPQPAAQAASEPETVKESLTVANTLALQDALYDKLRDGTATLDEYKAGWQALQDSRAAILAEFEGMKKDALLKYAGARYKNDRKPELVRAAMRDLESNYSIGRGISWSMGTSLTAAYAAQVESTTDADLKAFADKVADARKAREQRLAGVKEPKTIDDFTLAARMLGSEEKLTAEQRQTFDRLRADARREQRDADAKRNAVVRQVDTGGTGMELVETKHTQKGHDLFVVKTAERVDPETYKALNAAAKRLGGYYSSFRGNGAIPGFTFTSRENAESFMAVRDGNVDASGQQQAKAEAKSDRRAESLAEKAANLKTKAEESLNRDRKDNTARRAAQAASAEAEARKQLALANTMERLAAAIESGKARMLAFVRHKSQVEMFDRAVRDAHWAHLRDQGVQWEKAKEMPLSADSLTNATLPKFYLSRGDAAVIARRLIATRGGKAYGESLAKLVDYGDEYGEAVRATPHKFVVQKTNAEGGDRDFAFFETKRSAEAALARSADKLRGAVVKIPNGKKAATWAVALHPDLAIERKLWAPDYDQKVNLNLQTARKIVELLKVSERGDQQVPHWWIDHLAKRDALAKLGIETNFEYREALREYLSMREAPAGEDRVRKLERELAGNKAVGVDFFPTPPAVVQRLIEQADIQPGHRVLEPSAGKGDIAEAVRDAAENVTVDTVEMSSTLREILEAKGFETIGQDFLAVPAEPVYDRIVMNPPFLNDNGAAHVRHAYSMLKPGGRLVAVMGNGSRGAEAFDAWLEKVGGLSEPLPEGSFKSSFRPTGVSTKIVEIERGDGPLESVETPAERASFNRQLAYGFNGSDGVGMTDAERSAFDVLDAEVSSADGIRDADRLGLMPAVNNAMGGYPPVTVTYLRGEAGMRLFAKKGFIKQLQLQREGRKARTAGLYLRAHETLDGKPRVLLFTDVVTTPEDAAFTASHEIAGHHGIRRKFGRKLDPALHKAGYNETVNAVARSVYKKRDYAKAIRERGKTPAEMRLLSIEEALSDLAAATRTGNYAEIQKRHGVEVPLEMRSGLRATIARIVNAIRSLFRTKNIRMTDAQVHSLLENAWKAAQTTESAISTPESALESTEGGPFGPVYSNADFEAGIDTLLREKTGEIRGGMFHPSIGPVDVIYGEAGTPAKNYEDGYGLAKIAAKHPEVYLHNLADQLLRAPNPVMRGNTATFDTPDYTVVVKRDWKGSPKDWLLTAFEPKSAASGSTTIGAAATRAEARSGRDAAGADSSTTQGALESTEDQTQSEAFKKWFGNAGVRDNDGNPQVFFHSGNVNFDRVEEGRGRFGGIFALPNKSAKYGAMDHKLFLRGPVATTDDLREFVRDLDDGGASIVSDALGINPGDAVDAAIEGALNESASDDFKNAIGEADDSDAYAAMQRLRGQIARAAGFTSVEIYDEFDGAAVLIVRSGAAKSADKNNGNFDPSNPSILESVESVADAFTAADSRLGGRRALDAADPYAVENRRLREQDKTLWEKAKTLIRRELTPAGLLPQSVFAEKIQRDVKFRVVEFDVENLNAHLEKAIKDDYGVRAEKLPEGKLARLGEALAGKVNPNIPEKTRTAILAMRQYIDTMSTEYLGILQARIDVLADKARATDRDTDKAAELNEVEMYERIKGNIGAYVHRSYRAFDDAKWFQKVPTETINAAREYLAAGYREDGASQSEARRLSDVTINEILKNGTAYDSMESFLTGGKLGAKDLSVLMRRKEIAPEIRNLLGEHTDPRMNFTKSATKMGRLIWNDRFLGRVREMGMGAFLHEGKNRPADATTQIAADGSSSMAPLNGLWTTPEVAQAFEDALGKDKMGDIYRTVVRLNGLVKVGKTVLSPTTAMRNWQSAMFFTLANGHFDLTQMKKSIAAFRHQVLHNAQGDELAYIRHMQELGVVYDTPYAGEMRRYIEDSKLEDLLEGKTGDVAHVMRQISKTAQGFYSFGDDFWKIIGFENEKASLIKAGFEHDAAEKMAAERIRNTYPTYSMIGKSVKWLSRFPLAGTFVSFPSEIIRTTANMFQLVASDLKSDNPKLRELGTRRAVGMAMVSAGFYAMAALAKSALGVDDDEEEAVRDLAAPWQKNSTFLFTGRDADGKLRYFDLSFLDPYGYWKRPLTAMMRNQPWEESAASAIKGLLEPFFGTDIAAGAIFEVMANKKESGGRVYSPNGDVVDQTTAIANHMRKALQPGFMGNAERLYLAGTGARREGSGQPYEMHDEVVALLGWRASTMDTKTALYYRSFEFSDALVDARKELTRTLRSSNKVSPADIATSREKAERQYDQAFTQMQRLVTSARSAGMSNSEIMQTLNLSGVSKENAAYLIRGKTPPFRIGTQAAKSAYRNARIMRGEEYAREIASRFREANVMRMEPTEETE